jgi:hypothetical protein
VKKLTLDVEMLAVESFATDAAAREEGTVQAYEAPTPPYRTCSCTTGASYLAFFCPPPPAA